MQTEIISAMNYACFYVQTNTHRPYFQNTIPFHWKLLTFGPFTCSLGCSFLRSLVRTFICSFDRPLRKSHWKFDSFIFDTLIHSFHICGGGSGGVRVRKKFFFCPTMVGWFPWNQYSFTLYHVRIPPSTHPKRPKSTHHIRTIRTRIDYYLNRINSDFDIHDAQMNDMSKCKCKSRRRQQNFCNAPKLSKIIWADTHRHTKPLEIDSKYQHLRFAQISRFADQLDGGLHIWLIQAAAVCSIVRIEYHTQIHTNLHTHMESLRGSR